LPGFKPPKPENTTSADRANETTSAPQTDVNQGHVGMPGQCAFDALDAILGHLHAVPQRPQGLPAVRVILNDEDPPGRQGPALRLIFDRPGHVNFGLPGRRTSCCGRHRAGT
jgi:hypothetical protein